MVWDFKAHLSNWRANPRRMQPRFILARLRRYTTRQLRRLFNRHRPLNPPINTSWVALLRDPAFRSSVGQVEGLTLLDEARLAHVWNTVQLVGDGTFLEVGSYRGGTALHICNAMDDSRRSAAKFYCFDPFEKGNFETFRPDEVQFGGDRFTATDYAEVVQLLSSKPHARAVQGYFPQAAEPFDLRNIAFCHLDVDLYDATLKSLNFLAPRLAPRSAILIDDLDNKETPTVREAVNDFLAGNPSFLLIEMFPYQGLLLPLHLW